MMETEIGVTQLQAKDGQQHQKLRESHETDAPLEPSKKHGPDDTWTSDF